MFISLGKEIFMKIIAQEEIGICVDDITGVISYIHRGDEFEISP